MHYADGTPVKLGDIVTGNSAEHPFVGVVIGGNPGAETCNVNVAGFINLNAFIYGQNPTFVGHVCGTSGKVIGTGAVRAVDLGCHNAKEVTKIGHLPLGVLPPATHEHEVIVSPDGVSPLAEPSVAEQPAEAPATE